MKFGPKVTPDTHVLVSDMLIVTGGEQMVVGVAMDSVYIGVDCDMDIWGCETPTVTFGHGAIVIWIVVATGEGGEKSGKNSFVMETEVGIEKDTSGLV